MIAFGSQLWQLPPPFNMVVLVVAIVFTFLLVATIVSSLRKYASHREEIAFKRELIDRGLNADEIEVIINSGGQYDTED